MVDDESPPLVIKGHRIVILFELRDEIIQKLPIGHFGIEKTNQRARDDVFWPRLNSYIESSSQDLFECDGKNYLSLQYYYHRCIEVERFYSTHTSFIIMKIKGILARHGISGQVFSDNEPQFSSALYLTSLQIHGDSSIRHSVPDIHSITGWQRRPCRLRRESQ